MLLPIDELNNLVCYMEKQLKVPYLDYYGQRDEENPHLINWVISSQNFYYQILEDKKHGKTYCGLGIHAIYSLN